VELDDGGWRWLSGAFLSAVFLAVVIHDSISTCTVPPPEVGPVSANWCVEAWINRYQTLVAGGLAFLGAWLTVQRISAQIKQAADAEDYRREREEIASRAKLLTALNILSNYAEDCIQQLGSLRSNGSPRLRIPSNFKLPRRPRDAIIAMENCLQYTRTDRINSVRGVLTWVQIQSARVSDRRSIWISSDTGRDGALFDAIQLKVLADKLYNYARGRQEYPYDRTIGPGEFRNTAFFLNIYEADFPDLFLTIERTNWESLQAEYI
jgi:hypothetical protein